MSEMAADGVAMAPLSGKKYILSPTLDFLLLGGASLVAFPLAMVLFPASHPATWGSIGYVLTAVFYVNFIANFPHFMYSYQLLYRRFGDKVAGRVDPALRGRYIFAGIAVPVALFAFLAAGALRHDTQLLRLLPNLMFLAAGWHYAKQGFGMLIATSVYQKFFYTPLERKILLLNANLVWILAWVMFNTGVIEKNFFGIHFHTLGLPPVLQAGLTAIVVAAGGVLLVALGMKCHREKRLPPLTGLTAYISSIYLWVILRFGMGADQPIHPIVTLIPALHSVQYMAVVLKMKSNEVRQGAASRRSFWGFALLGIVTGALAFIAIPELLDRYMPYDREVFGASMFMFLFWIFINVHHYFVDNVIWRRENSETKQYLFSPG
jgi:hypothetical protein